MKKRVDTKRGFGRRGRRPATRTPGKKPEVRIVEMSDGKIKIINGTVAAEFCGVSQQAFANVVRRYYAELRNPKPETQFERAKRRVREAYPELFNIKKTGERK